MLFLGFLRVLDYTAGGFCDILILIKYKLSEKIEKRQSFAVILERLVWEREGL